MATTRAEIVDESVLGEKQCVFDGLRDEGRGWGRRMEGIGLGNV